MRGWLRLPKKMLKKRVLRATSPLSKMRVQDLRSDKINGGHYSNPPYGERLSDDAGVTKLYAEMGEVFEPLKTWSKFILTSDENFEKKFKDKQIKTKII